MKPKSLLTAIVLDSLNLPIRKPMEMAGISTLDIGTADAIASTVGPDPDIMKLVIDRKQNMVISASTTPYSDTDSPLLKSLADTMAKRLEEDLAKATGASESKVSPIPLVSLLDEMQKKIAEAFAVPSNLLNPANNYPSPADFILSVPQEPTSGSFTCEILKERLPTVGVGSDLSIINWASEDYEQHLSRSFNHLGTVTGRLTSTATHEFNTPKISVVDTIGHPNQLPPIKGTMQGSIVIDSIPRGYLNARGMSRVITHVDDYPFIPSVTEVLNYTRSDEYEISPGILPNKEIPNPVNSNPNKRHATARRRIAKKLAKASKQRNRK